MKVVIYACVKVSACEGKYRRVRIVMDGTRVTSVQMPDPKWDHDPCYHGPTANEYIDTCLDYAWPPDCRQRTNGVKYNLPSSEEDIPLC